MSPALSSFSMTMRARVSRDAAADDGYGAPGTPADLQIVSDAEPCFVWVTSKRFITDQKVMVVEDIRGVFRADTEILTGDRMEIFDRRGRALLDGTLEIEAITDKMCGSVIMHREALLRRYHA